MRIADFLLKTLAAIIILPMVAVILAIMGVFLLCIGVFITAPVWLPIIVITLILRALI